MTGRSLNWITDMPKRFSPADDGPLRMSLTDLSSSRRSWQSGDEGGGESPPPSAGIQNIVRSKHQQCFVRTMQQHTWSDSGSMATLATVVKVARRFAAATATAATATAETAVVARRLR